MKEADEEMREKGEEEEEEEEEEFVMQFLGDADDLVGEEWCEVGARCRCCGWVGLEGALPPF